MNKKNILVIQGKLLHYRFSFYQELSNHFHVTVMHSGVSHNLIGYSFREIVIPAKKFGPFFWQFNIIREIKTGRYDAVIAGFDLRWLSTFFVMFLYDKDIPWIWWGLDEGKSKLALIIKRLIAHRDNPIVFYNHMILEKFEKLGLGKHKLFLANNTFHVENRIQAHLHPIKNVFINVGSLDSRKQNEIALRAFKKILDNIEDDIKFILIGEGEARKAIEETIDTLALREKVVLIGQINNPDVLKNFYGEAIASISYGQAGLAVLQSMAFGVPFITNINAISGGEKENIYQCYNGLFCHDEESLKYLMLRLLKNIEWARKLGSNAFEYYTAQCSLEGMVKGFLQAYEYKCIRKKHQIATAGLQQSKRSSVSKTK